MASEWQPTRDAPFDRRRRRFIARRSDAISSLLANRTCNLDLSSNNANN